ncbi:MAG: recombinase zinc beta ribbon domain-containing protein, partial [Clostridia bacterium]|nr:recombinase zinc beta ribbon domain-containing protein [Clostridia bacterium]
FRGKQYNGKHTPLIDEGTFEEARQVLKRNSRAKGSSEYLLSSLLYCGNCGAKMRYMKWGKGEKATTKILCYSRFPSNKSQLIKNPDCDNFVYDAEEVEEKAVGKLMEFSVRYSDDIDNNRLIEGDIVKILEKKLSEVKEEYKRCILAYRKIGDENILEQAAEVDRERKKIERDISDERAKRNMLSKIEADEERIKSLPSTWKNMTAKERQKIMKTTVAKIILTSGNMKMILNKTQYEILTNSSLDN